MKSIHSLANLMKMISCGLLCSLPMFAIVPASAEIIAYEGFGDYDLGGLNGVLGSEGSGITYWEGHNSLFQVRAETLDYGLPTEPQHLDMSSGGTELKANLDVSAEGPFAAYIDSLGRIGKDGTTLYISFLFRVDNDGELMTSGDTQANWRFRKSSSGSAWGLQQPYNGGTIQLNNALLLPQLDRKTHFIILKIEFAAGADTVTAWVDPLLGAEESAYTPTATISVDASFDQLYFKGQGNDYFFDELRIGETFDDVTANIRLSPPASPVNFAVSTLSDTELVLTWEDLSLNEEGFRIERATTADGPFTALPDLAADTTVFIDSGLLPLSEYFYRVSSFNGFGDSAPTAVVSMTTLAEGLSVPSTPGGLAGSLVDRNISLTWTDASDVEFGYRVYRAVGAGNFVLIAEIAADSAAYIDSGRPVGENLRYRVTAFNDLGESLAAEIAMDPVPDITEGPDWVWIEGEDFATTTFRGNGDSWLSPRASEVDGLSNGDNFSFLPNDDEKNAGYIYDYRITYNINIPKDGDYLLYVRRSFNYALFKWRIDGGEWNYVGGDLPRFEDVPWREFFPLSWVEGGSTTTTEGAHVLEISHNPGIDFPDASASQMNQFLIDCMVLTQVPFKPVGKAKPGSKYARANEGYWPFEPSADSYVDSPIDLRYLNEDVAGQDGWVTRVGDEFFLGNGEKVRFFGATVGTGTFSSYSAQAQFLAKKGFNIVRWHQSIDDRDEDSDSINNVNDAMIESAQQCVAAFKQHGIYTNLSHFFILGHRVRAAWNIPGYDLMFTLNKDRAPFGIFFWNEDFKAAYKAWVNELLTRPNPWDAENTPLAEDPAVAMFEILNEDNLFFFTFSPSEYPEVQRLALEKLFGDWLTAKFGSLQAAADQWGGTLRTRDNLETGHIEVLSAGTLRPGTTATALRGMLQSEWMAELQTNFWTEIKDYIRSLGCEALVIPTNWKTARDQNLRDLEYYTYSAVDIVDLHNYFSFVGTRAVDYAVSLGDVYRNVSAIERPEAVSVAYKQVEDRPSILSEFTWTNPNDLASEAPLITAAYASLQDVDGLFWFSYSTVGYDNTIERWPVGTPDIMGQFPGTALLYRRGDVAEAPVAFREGRSIESLNKLEESLIVQGSGFDPTRDTGWDPQTGEGTLGMETALVGKVELAFGEDWDYLHPDYYANADFDNGIFKSLTGQVELNQPDGIVKVDTPTAKGVTGFLGDYGEVAFDDCIVRLDNAFGAVLVISLDGLPISRSGKVLIQAAVPDATYGYEVDNAVYLGQPAWSILNLGEIPFSMQNIEGEVVLKGFAGAQPQILDLNGYPFAAPVSFAEGGDLRITLPFNSLYTVVTREATDVSPVILSTVLPSPVVDKDYTGMLHASGGDGSYTWSVVGGSLPEGITLSADGTLSGMTSAVSAEPVTVRVEDGTGATAQATLAVSIVSEVASFEPGWIDDENMGLIYRSNPSWAYSFTMGWIYLSERPWVYANPVGWMHHASGDMAAGLWWYSPDRGWIIVHANHDGSFQYSNDGVNWNWDLFSL
ncbi:MAG: putative Ig domain-containing protein [Oceanipulchritudo sp.]